MLRQVCLAALLAQAGAWVPAESLELTPVDAIFVRMGARDAIMSGQVPPCMLAAMGTSLPSEYVQTHSRCSPVFTLHIEHLVPHLKYPGR